jgi:hypothetical protein
MQTLTAHDQRRVSVLAFCDSRSVARYVAGRTLRTMLKLRIELALKELGFDHLVRTKAGRNATG